MKKLLLVLFIFPFVLQAQDSLFQKKMFIGNGDTLPYRILLPKNYDPGKRYPMVIFLHGSGERGNDNEAQLVHGSKLFLADSNRTKFPAIVVFPQCPDNSFWSNVQLPVSEDTPRVFKFLEAGAPTVSMALLEYLMRDLINVYPVQRNKIYVGGLSMGGMGTLELLRRNPKFFAAAFSICGGANPKTARKIKNIPLWLFHGAKDDVVPPKYSLDMAEALLKLNAEVKMTVYPEANHNSWDATFAEPELLPWLFSHKKK
ncbi:prolyl oligopeptidase family serine peptidase [Ferruginibacter sp. HRS2-29]|uniref:carboxylesterase family protein n=1 Tax=Ferruginibacter sp. HRS2-29 TaxID=2487334 RepID=UPI0020CD4B03|nr:prolyl oligopeptidase family serine peptidase [Ferruginibacter sp. HRS2-29]MCP9749709.1 phospholipase [Ferruginibacter sp. HRS2-29]